MESSNKPGQLAAALRQRILSGLVLGLVKEGDRLAGVRETSQEFGVNERSVLTAWRQLELEGLIERRRRSGVYVATSRDSQGADGERHADWFAELLTQAVSRDLPAPELSRQLSRIVDGSDLHALVIECNDDQLWSLSDELRRDYGFRVTTLDLDVLRVGGAPPLRSFGADLTVTTSFHQQDVEALTVDLAIPVFAVTMCTELFAEVRVLLSRQPVYFVVSDRRMARKLHRIFGDTVEARNLRTLVFGEDDIDAIPSAAAVYATRFTRTQVGASRVLRGMPEARIFSAGSARALFSFMVRARLESRVFADQMASD